MPIGSSGVERHWGRRAAVGSGHSRCAGPPTPHYFTATGASIAPATDDLLQDWLDRATDMIRQALRAMLSDPGFDWAARGLQRQLRSCALQHRYLLQLPPHQAQWTLVST